MTFDMKRKCIYLNRITIDSLDKPPYLVFRLDMPNKRFIVLPAFEEDEDVYEIPQFYWRNARNTCQICRLPFFLALTQFFNRDNERLYAVQGIFQVLEDSQKLVVFNFDDVVESGEFYN
jgi:hypothetical protein